MRRLFLGINVTRKNVTSKYNREMHVAKGHLTFKDENIIKNLIILEDHFHNENISLELY